MRVDQPRQERLLAKIDNFTSVAHLDLIKFPDIDDSILGNHDCAIVDGGSIHRHDGPRAKDHSACVAVLCEHRKCDPVATALCAVLRVALCDDSAIGPPTGRWLQINRGVGLSPLSGIRRPANCTLPGKATGL